jgi:hypothetical protein
MGKFLLLAGISLFMAGSLQARIEKLYIIDMTGAKFTSHTFNLMDDGISGDFDGFGIKLDGKFNQDFTVQTKASNADGDCRVRTAKISGKQTVLKVIADLDVDSGDTCDVKVIYSNGKKATLSIYSEGT